MGCFTIGVDRDPQAPARYAADEFYCADPADPQLVESVAKARHADAIFPLAEFGVIPAAVASRKLVLRHISPESAALCHDKILMREAWGRHGIEQPRFAVVCSANEAHRAADNLGFPLVLKPRALWGARGVRRVTSHAELTVLYEETAILSKNTLLLEQYVEGVETSVEGVVVDGTTHVLAYADKELRAHPRNRVTRSLNYPGAFQDQQLSAINTCAAKCTRALGLDNSLFHLEVFVTNHAVLPIECGARGGGGHIASHIVKLVSGVDLISVAIDLLLGNKPALAMHETPRGVCYRFLFPPEGILLSLPSEETVLHDRRIVSLVYAVKPGDLIREPDHGGLRAGYLLTEGIHRQAAIEAADEIEQKLKWTVA